MRLRFASSGVFARFASARFNPLSKFFIWFWAFRTPKSLFRFSCSALRTNCRVKRFSCSRNRFRDCSRVCLTRCKSAGLSLILFSFDSADAVFAFSNASLAFWIAESASFAICERFDISSFSFVLVALDANSFSFCWASVSSFRADSACP